MLKVSAQALEEIEDALRRYQQEVRATALRESTQRTYLQHADSFVRWLRDDFEPGATLK